MTFDEWWDRTRPVHCDCRECRTLKSICHLAWETATKQARLRWSQENGVFAKGDEVVRCNCKGVEPEELE